MEACLDQEDFVIEWNKLNFRLTTKEREERIIFQRVLPFRFPVPRGISLGKARETCRVLEESTTCCGFQRNPTLSLSYGYRMLSSLSSYLANYILLPFIRIIFDDKSRSNDTNVEFCESSSKASLIQLCRINDDSRLSHSTERRRRKRTFHVSRADTCIHIASSLSFR